MQFAAIRARAAAGMGGSAAAVFMIIAYLSGHLVFANYLQIHHSYNFV